MPSLPPKMKILLILAKNCWKIEITHENTISHENYSLSQIICEWLWIVKCFQGLESLGKVMELKILKSSDLS